MATRFPSFVATTVAVADNDFTVVGNTSSNARSTIFIDPSESGVEVYYAFTDTQPSATSTMLRIPIGKAVSFDVLGVPGETLYLYQNSGASVNVKVAVGVKA
jgi:hypothetical protein